MFNFINMLPLTCLSAGKAGQFEKSKQFLIATAKCRKQIIQYATVCVSNKSVLRFG
jgi:hypothetical protein